MIEHYSNTVWLCCDLNVSLKSQKATSLANETMELLKHWTVLYKNISEHFFWTKYE